MKIHPRHYYDDGLMPLDWPIAPVGARLPPWVLVAMAQAIPLDIERLFGEGGSHLESSP